MTTGFDQQTTHYGAICRSAPKPQTLGAKSPGRDPKDERPPEPRSFAQKAAV